jgi:hypothetical protein
VPNNPGQVRGSEVDEDVASDMRADRIAAVDAPPVIGKTAPPTGSVISVRSPMVALT